MAHEALLIAREHGWNRISLSFVMINTGAFASASLFDAGGAGAGVGDVAAGSAAISDAGQSLAAPVGFAVASGAARSAGDDSPVSTRPVFTAKSIVVITS